MFKQLDKNTLRQIVQFFKEEMDEWEHYCPGCGKDISRYEPHHIHPDCLLSRATEDLDKLSEELL